MPKRVSAWIKDENETSINVTRLRYHPTSVLPMLNELQSCQRFMFLTRTPERKDYKNSHTKHVANLPQTYHNMSQPPQGCMIDTSINPENEATIVPYAADIIILDGWFDKQQPTKKEIWQFK